MENELKNLDIDKLPCPSWWRHCARPPKAASARDPGSRLTARGRDNVVNCLACEPIYDALEALEKR